MKPTRNDFAAAWFFVIGKVAALSEPGTSEASNGEYRRTFVVPRPLGSGPRGPLPNGRGTDFSNPISV